MNNKALSLPFESRRLSWVVADTLGGRYPELASERIGFSMEKWTHFLDTQTEACWCRGDIRTLWGRSAQRVVDENCHELVVSDRNNIGQSQA